MDFLRPSQWQLPTEGGIVTGGLTIALFFIIIVSIVLRVCLCATHHVQEPPMVGYTIPFISPILGLAKKKVRYLIEIRDRHHLPVSTLRLPFAKIYIVASPPLITMIERQVKNFRFLDMSVEAMIRINGVSARAQKTMRANLDPGDQMGMAATLFKIIHGGLSQGSVADALTRDTTKNLNAFFNQAAMSQETIVGLYGWVESFLVTALTDAMYGPRNPFRKPGIIQAYRAFETEFGSLIFGFLPTLTAVKAVVAREKVAKAFETYYSGGGHNDAAQLVRSLFDVSRIYDLSIPDIAHMEITTAMVALLSNTIPGAFWTIFHIYSDPAILEACRKEVLACVTERASTTRPMGYSLDLINHPANRARIGGKTVRCLDAAKLNTNCPTLQAVFQEVLRVHSGTISARTVAKDTLLGDDYLLKKGNLVMIPTPVLHTDPSLWGADANVFNHRRFMFPTGARRQKLPALRAFGGGATLCPGRHFASAVIIALAAMCVLRFDIKTEGQGWQEPDTKKAHLGSGLLRPDEDVNVVVSRKDEEGIDWDVQFGEGSQRNDPVAEGERSTWRE
ncbi:cytochrome P450 [Clohesyomyces aquaticus]|uniref:Cytochrome P450 n=1 Tax=Clohesyomyces aquaticus TaxID=1231657 RepID=A0A1Y1YMF3_9PLEO|nr:cytochrome P450 [Clohesyomyces aquaticus]